jgi:hypothetical protein
MRRRYRGLATLNWPLMVVDPPVTRTPQELYLRALATGWTEPEARNLMAYALGLQIADGNHAMRPWTGHTLNRLLWLRWLYEHRDLG